MTRELSTAPVRRLPSGTVTFLFTDAEGSTKLLNAHPEQYRRAVRRHHDLLVEAVHLADGIVFETVGDAVYAAFAHPTDAVKAALWGQLALAAEDWGETPIRVRMGIHLGEVEVQATPEAGQGAHYFGEPLYRCARLMSTAHGGQVVLSEVVAAAVRDALPDGATLLDLGEHRLKDLARREHIYQLLHPELPADFPPLRSQSVLAHNLPLQITSFVGREQELAAVSTLLTVNRLMTLTGSGGAGKTRLAAQVAATALPLYPDGAWLVELESIADPGLVPQAVASVIGVREEPGRPLLVTLADALRPKHLLLVLDNCEHLLEACARLAAALLRACPAVTILATSREVLGVAGECGWRVPPLALPPHESAVLPATLDAQALQQVTASEAVRLFVDRARLVQPAFTVTAGNAPLLVELCHQLDGMPLPLELAAARLRNMTIDQLAARLDDRFRLLTGGSRAALPRQQTLRALVDWSYDLLTPSEQALLRRLSVFAGGWSLEAAEQICAGDPDRPDDIDVSYASGPLPEAVAVLDLLLRLVDKSLVLAEPRADGTMRYGLLETLRHYGREKLAAAGETEMLHALHGTYFLQLAEHGVPGSHGSPQSPGSAQQVWLAYLAGERDNLRAALAWWHEQRRASEGLRLALALYTFWTVGGHYREALEWFDAFLALADSAGEDVPAALRARGLDRAGLLAQWQGDHTRAQALLEASVALWRVVGDTPGLASALESLAMTLWLQGDEARTIELNTESLALAREHGDAFTISRCLRDRGLVACVRHEYGQAATLFEESVAHARAAGHDGFVARGLSLQGRAAYLQGNVNAASALLTQGLVAHRRAAESGHGVDDNLEWLAAVFAAQGDARRAAYLFGAAESLRRATGIVRYAPERAAYERDMAAARSKVDPAAFEAWWAVGQAMSLEQAVACALAGHDIHAADLVPAA